MNDSLAALIEQAHAVSSRQVALSAPALVRLLLDREPDAYAAVQRFIDGQTDTDRIVIAGPPKQADLDKKRRNPGMRLPLPTVTLQCKMVKHHLTGADGVRVTCSDRDLDELKSWHAAALLDEMRKRSRLVING